MKFKTQLTAKLLESNLSGEQIGILPASYQKLGDICLIHLNKELEKHKTIIGKAIIELFPYFKAVCVQKGITEQKRKPNIELIAGKMPKEVIVAENNCMLKLNPKEIMYSHGNHAEKKRIISLVKENEVVVDMFAGIGYFSIPIAKTHPNAKVISIEINPNAFKYLKENIRLNYLANVFPLLGNCDAVITRDFPKANRILMGLIPSCKKYIPAAMKIAKKGTVIHYHGLAEEGMEAELFRDFSNYRVKLLQTKVIKSYKPHVNHVSLDILVVW
ncbi:MAG: methyltransferase domain-containing protein [Nanoarchaeota archaeon]